MVQSDDGQPNLILSVTCDSVCERTNHNLTLCIHETLPHPHTISFANKLVRQFDWTLRMRAMPSLVTMSSKSVTEMKSNQIGKDKMKACADGLMTLAGLGRILCRCMGLSRPTNGTWTNLQKPKKNHGRVRFAHHQNSIASIDASIYESVNFGLPFTA